MKNQVDSWLHFFCCCLEATEFLSTYIDTIYAGSISTIKLPGFHGSSRFGVFEKNTYQQQNHHGSKAQKPGLLDEIPFKSFKVKKSPYIMGNLRRPFTPAMPRFSYQKIAGLLKGLWSPPWSPKKKPLVRHPWIPMTLNYRNGGGVCFLFFRDGWIQFNGIFESNFAKNKSTKRNRLIPENPSWLSRTWARRSSYNWVKIFHFPTSFSSHWFSHASMRNKIWLFGHV